MSVAWKILLALTLSRMCIGAQFQSVPALATYLASETNLNFAAIGTLTGAYLLPGVIAALTTGWLGLRLGDIRVALFGLALMTVGSAGLMAADSFSLAVTLRLLAGVGAVGLNVVTSKMVADWFQDRADLPTAMGVFVSSWPAGLALGMLALPPISGLWGLDIALAAPGLLSLLAFLLLARVWRAPPERGDRSSVAMGDKMLPREWVLVLWAGLIWGVYNVAFIATIAWMPGVLHAVGVGELRASTSVSLIGWSAIVSVAGGGWLAARSPWRDLPPVGCFVLAAAFLIFIPGLGAVAAAPLMMVMLGLILGTAAAMIMTLPVEATRPKFRSLAMGTYFAVYYGMMGVSPSIFGWLRDATGDPAGPLYVAAALMVLCTAMWFGFRKMQSDPR